MTGQLTSPLIPFTAPALNLPPQQLQNSRGLCSLSFGGNTLPFRTNPNSIKWNYNLITHIDQTYGGRVIQILGVKMDNLVVKVDCGQGGVPYMMQIVQFMRDLMVTQRNGQPATFLYTTRGWNLKVFAQNVPFQDEVTATVRELELRFKIQEDVSGLNRSASIADALARLSDGIGWTVSQFNNFTQGTGANNNNDQGNGGFFGTPTVKLQDALQAATQNTAGANPQFGNLLGGLSGIFGGL